MRYYFILCLILVASSCSNNEEQEPIDEILTSEFFPLEIGHTNVYQVDEIIFNKRRQSKEALSFQLKEEITESFIDDSGNTVYTVDRYTRPASNDGWTYQNSWQAMITGNQAIRIEQNRRYIKLRLPASKDDEWDGNALFDDSEPIIVSGDPIDYYKNWTSNLFEMNGSETIGDQQYSDIYKISLADYENKLELRYGREYYASGIGLVYREIKVLDTQCFDECSATPWEDKAENGHIYIQSILK